MRNLKHRLRLVLPSPEMKNLIMNYRELFLQNGEKHIHGTCGLHNHENFIDWYNAQRKIARGECENNLPATTYFAVYAEANGRLSLAGAANIRHYLNEQSYRHGHIGYSVSPDKRRMGYGTEILRLALIKANEFGIIEPVVSCAKFNTGSKKIIEANGFTFSYETNTDGYDLLVYIMK